MRKIAVDAADITVDPITKAPIDATPAAHALLPSIVAKVEAIAPIAPAARKVELGIRIASSRTRLAHCPQQLTSGLIKHVIKTSLCYKLTSEVLTI